jgi:hypothetical protein
MSREPMQTVRRLAALCAAVVAILPLALSTTARAATITVNSLADTGASGICVLRDAITAANTMTATNGCAAGTGTNTIQFSLTGTIDLASTLPTVIKTLTINGPASPGITINGGGKVRVMQVGSGAELTLNNLTIANGFDIDVPYPGFGGESLGGGIYNEGTLTITNGTFSGNSAFGPPGSNYEGDGGGIYNEGTLTVTNSTFSNNGNGSFGEGGGIDNAGTLTVTNSTFSGNGIDSSQLGAGIANGYKATVTNSTFSGNSAYNGGGIYNQSAFDSPARVGAMLTVTNSTFSGNSSDDGGGGIYNEAAINPYSPTSVGGTLTVSNSTFSGNSATYGGGIFTGYNATVSNSTFSGNRSSGGVNIGLGGGGINNWAGTLTVSNSTFSRNQASFGNQAGSGGGVFNYDYYPSSMSFKSTILADNDGGNCGGAVTHRSRDAGYNISDDSTCSFAKTGSANNGDGVNPLLSPAGLANNGGPTQTIALLADSPAIDAIPLAYCTDQSSPPQPITSDQRGFPRPDCGEQVCDIGAYEFQDCSLSLTDILNIYRNGDFNLYGGFTVVGDYTVDPATQPVTFTLGDYSLTIPAGSFKLHGNDYEFQQNIDGVFLCFDIYLTSTPGKYLWSVGRQGGTLNVTSNPVPVTLIIGGIAGYANFNAVFYE